MKHNLFSRFLSIALVLVMVASVMPASILADDELMADASSVVSEIVESVLPEETPAAVSEELEDGEEYDWRKNDRRYEYFICEDFSLRYCSILGFS